MQRHLWSRESMRYRSIPVFGRSRFCTTPLSSRLRTVTLGSGPPPQTGSPVRLNPKVFFGPCFHLGLVALTVLCPWNLWPYMPSHTSVPCGIWTFILIVSNHSLDYPSLGSSCVPLLRMPHTFDLVSVAGGRYSTATFIPYYLRTQSFVVDRTLSVLCISDGPPCLGSHHASAG